MTPSHLWESAPTLDSTHLDQEVTPTEIETSSVSIVLDGSANVEKDNDLLVARRQKHKGMYWSLDTSDSLCALKTLMLNHGWELYWQKREVLSHAA
jgi:hypothetical protein